MFQRFVKGVWVVPRGAKPNGSSDAVQFFQGREAVMVTFVGTLLVGAVAGWMLEKNLGQPLVRWSRLKRMQMRVLRRQGESPLRAWRSDEE